MVDSDHFRDWISSGCVRDREGRFMCYKLLGKKDSRGGAEGVFEEKTEEARSEAASSHSSISNFEFKI